VRAATGPCPLAGDSGGLVGCRPDKAFTLPSGNTFARWRFAYRAYGPFLSPTDTNLLSGCKFSYSKIIKIGYVLAEYAAKARVASQ
ncbi:hypothetical protein C9F07_17675, partial [Salmonella enterica subsp. enterica serovar Poona]